MNARTLVPLERAARPGPVRHAGWRGAVVALALGAVVGAAPAAMPMPAQRLAASAERIALLAERAAKAYCLIGLGTENREPAGVLAATLAELAAARRELGAAEVAPAREARARLGSDLDEIPRLAARPVSRPGARALGATAARAAERALAIAAAVAPPDGATARAWTLARGLARAEVLTERLARSYAELAWDVDPEQSAEQFVAAWMDTEETLARLASMAADEPGLRPAIATVVEEWRWLRATAGFQDEGLFYPGLVDRAAERVQRAAAATRARLDRRPAPAP